MKTSCTSCRVRSHSGDATQGEGKKYGVRQTTCVIANMLETMILMMMMMMMMMVMMMMVMMMKKTSSFLKPR